MMRRFDPWLDVVHDVVSRPGTFPRDLLMDGLHETFQCSITHCTLRRGGHLDLHLRDPIPGWPTPDQHQVWRSRGRHLHPLVRWYAASGDRGAMSLGRVPAHLVDPAFRRVIRELLLPDELAQQLSVPFAHAEGAQSVFVLAKAGPDFPDEDFALARLIQPLLSLLGRHFDLLPQVSLRGAHLGLSERERLVLDLLAQGLTAVAIGHRLEISSRTVHAHLRNIYRKLGVHDRLLAVQVYRQDLDGVEPEVHALPA